MNDFKLLESLKLNQLGSTNTFMVYIYERKNYTWNNENLKNITINISKKLLDFLPK